MAEVFIAFGGNVGDSRGILSRAIALFCDGTAVRLTARSHDYETPPWGVENQPPFVNLCILAETDLAPLDLLSRARDVERQLGRDRDKETRWGPRTADIDILAYEGVTVESTELTLPHPRIFERAFVLVPLAEIAGERLIAGTRVKDVAGRIDTANINRLPGP